MNYLITIKTSNGIKRYMARDTDPRLKDSIYPYIESVDDVISVMTKVYPEVKEYTIQETLLPIELHYIRDYE